MGIDRERVIIGAFLINDNLDPKNLGLEKKIFRSQDARLVCTQILAGIRDELEIFERLKTKSKKIGSYISSCTDGIHKMGASEERVRELIRNQKIELLNEKITKLINEGVRRRDYDHEKIKALYQKIDELSAEKEDITIFLSEVESRQVDWLWRNYFPLGRLSMLSGDPNDGKTFFGLDMSARVTRGTVWPDGSKVGEPGEVLYLSIEDQAADTLRPRIDSLKGDPSKIRVLRPDSEDFLSFAEKDGLKTFEGIIKGMTDIRLAVIDPILDFSGQINPNSAEQVRTLLSPLAKIAEKYGIAILLIGHLNKAQSMSALYRTGGSTGAWLGKCRAAFMIFRDQDDKGKRYLMPLKANLAPRDPDRWSFRIIEGRLEFEKVTEDLEIDDYINPQLRMEAREASHAVNWLRDILKSGPKDSKEIRTKAEENGIPQNTLYRAMRKLNIINKTEGFGKFKSSIWALPENKDAILP